MKKIKNKPFLPQLHKHLSLILLWICILLLALMGRGAAFADWYTVHIYRYLSAGITFLTDHLPMLLGELMMYGAGIGVILLILLLFLLLFLFRRVSFRRFVLRYLKVAFTVLSITSLVYVLLWYIPFHTTELTFGTDPEKEYSIQELVELRNELTNELNQCVADAPRDDSGTLILPENADELTREAAMKLGSDEAIINDSQSASFAAISNLSGTLPKGKSATCSMFLQWMGIGGYTFPYTQEVSINKYVSDFYRPSLYAHELSHHLGFYRENEGCFMSFLILKESDDPILRYSGTFTAWTYVQKAYRSNVAKLSEEQQTLVKEQETALDSRALEDNTYFQLLADEAFDQAVPDFMKDTFEEASKSVSNVGWQVQGDLLQGASYDGVVELLLRYFDSLVD